MDWMTHGSIPGKRLFSSKRPTSSGGLPSLLFIGYEGGSFLRGQRDNSLCLMAWLRMSGVTHLLPVRHYGIHRGNFTPFTSVHII